MVKNIFIFILFLFLFAFKVSASDYIEKLVPIAKVTEIKNGYILAVTYSKLNKKSELIINSKNVNYRKFRYKGWEYGQLGDREIFLQYKKIKSDYKLNKSFKKGDVVFIKTKVRKKKIEVAKTNNKKLEKTKTTKAKSTKVADNNLTIQVLEDNSSPNIIVSEEFESNSQLMVEITGSINDESEIASLTIDGYEISLTKSNFKKEFFVKPKGQDVEIVAIDIHGNKSSKIVSLKRQKEVIQQVKLDSLNPTKIQSNVSANKVALIIGVENYKNTFSALYAENDALYFNDFANTTLGVPKENIKLLTNDEADQNNTIKALIKWLPKVVVENRTELYLFFSGHGLASPDGEDLFLLPSDGDPEILEYSSLMRNEIFNNIAKLNPKSVTVFLDTCYSGETRSDEMLIASAKPIFIEAKEQDIPVNFNIFSASSNNEIATILDEAEHGLFSYYMMKGLEGEADNNNDRAITNGELHAFIEKNVSRQANQTPQLNGDPEKVIVSW